MSKEFHFNKVFDFLRKQPRNVPLEVFTSPYEVLISTVLSARTNDDVTLPTAKRLFHKAPDFHALNKLSIDEISKLIYPVGFYKTKAKNIKGLTEKILVDRKGNVPTTHKALTSLPGVGVKTANLVLARAFGKPAISVDTHVHKISNLLGWVHTKRPEQTEKELRKILPKKYWGEINTLFVSLGRNHKSIKNIKKVLRDNDIVA